MSNGFSAFLTPDNISQLQSSYSTAVGISAADVTVSSNIGSPYTQQNPPEQKTIGYTGVDLGSVSGGNASVPAGTQPAAVTIPNFSSPQIYRTKPYLFVPQLRNRFVGIMAGAMGADNLAWGDTDPINNESVAQDRTTKTAAPAKTYDPTKPIQNRGFGAWEGIVTHPTDIGQNFGDQIQTFDLFAGGLNRSLKNISPVITLDWTKGFDKFGEFYDMKTFYVENFMPWSSNAQDWMGTGQGWNRELKGQGWNAFQGFPIRLGAFLPVMRKVF